MSRNGLACLMLAALCSFPAVAQTATRAQAEQDPVLKAMLVELARNQQRLQLQDFQKPYFLEFRIDDVSAYEARADYGALIRQGESHARIAHVRVRVGDYRLDNSHVGRNGGGDGMVGLEVTDDDPVALRYGLWQATDTAYKIALAAYAAKQAELKSVQTPPQADDFAKAPPVIYLEPVRQISLDRDAWKQRIVEASGLFLTDAAVKSFASEIETSDASIQGRVRTEYLVNSEGTIVRNSTSLYEARANFSAQAADGMELARSAPFVEATADALPGAAHFRSAVVRALTGLQELRNAPLVPGEYHGPVLLEANASARAFDDLLARPLEARVPPLGSTARTTGAFATSYQARVLPDSFSVVDDPLMTTFDGKTLLGAYKVDDEGVAAQPVNLIQDGKLTGYDIDREPVRDFPASNGHGRAGAAQSPQSKIGVLEIKSADAVSDDDLEKKLMAMGKDQGLAYVYVIESLGAPTNPRTVVQIKVADGSSQTVRGVRLGDLDLRTMRSDIVAAGDKPHVENTDGEVLSTIIAPAILIDQLTVKRGDERNPKLPYYPPPAE